MVIHEVIGHAENEAIKTMTSIDFETYTPNEALRTDFSITSENCVGNIYTRINTFKKKP